MAGKKSAPLLAKDGTKINRTKTIKEALAAHPDKQNAEIAELVSKQLTELAGKKVAVEALYVGTVKSGLKRKVESTEVPALTGKQLSAFNKAAVAQFGGLDGVKTAILTVKGVVALENIGSIERAEEAIEMLEGFLAGMKE